VERSVEGNEEPKVCSDIEAVTIYRYRRPTKVAQGGAAGFPQRNEGGVMLR